MPVIDRNSPRVKKLPARYSGIVTPLLVSVLMSAIVSAVSTATNAGWDHFSSNWPHAWGASWLVAFPCLLLVLPLARRIVGAIVEQRT